VPRPMQKDSFVTLALLSLVELAVPLVRRTPAHPGRRATNLGLTGLTEFYDLAEKRGLICFKWCGLFGAVLLMVGTFLNLTGQLGISDSPARVNDFETSFLILFVLASVLNTAGLIGADARRALSHAAFALITTALAGVGLTADISLMRRTGTELFDEISEGAMLRLGRAIAACLGTLRATLEAGVTAGVFTVEDPVLLANTLYATGLGGLQLARVGLVIDEPSPGVPQVGRIGAEQVKALLLTSALAMASG